MRYPNRILSVNVFGASTGSEGYSIEQEGRRIWPRENATSIATPGSSNRLNNHDNVCVCARRKASRRTRPPARRFALGRDTQRTNGNKLEVEEAPTSRDIGGEGRARFPIIPNYECSD